MRCFFYLHFNSGLEIFMGQISENSGIIFRDFETIDLNGLDTYNLLNRFDRKFILKADDINLLLNNLSANYKVLEINDENIFDYESEYFDSDDLMFYFAHHNGKLNRFKLRKRIYNNTGEQYFEIKKKNNKGKTNKKRYKLSSDGEIITHDAELEIQNSLELNFNSLKPQLRIKYNRICLLNKYFPEKITIDTNLKFINGQTHSIDNIAIAEVKTAKPKTQSYFTDLLKHNSIRQSSISKYCFGIHLIYPDLKYNKFKNSFSNIERLNNGIIR